METDHFGIGVRATASSETSATRRGDAQTSSDPGRSLCGICGRGAPSDQLHTGSDRAGAGLFSRSQQDHGLERTGSRGPFTCASLGHRLTATSRNGVASASRHANGACIGRRSDQRQTLGWCSEGASASRGAADGRIGQREGKGSPRRQIRHVHHRAGPLASREHPLILDEPVTNSAEPVPMHPAQTLPAWVPPAPVDVPQSQFRPTVP